MQLVVPVVAYGTATLGRPGPGRRAVRPGAGRRRPLLRGVLGGGRGRHPAGRDPGGRRPGRGAPRQRPDGRQGPDPLLPAVPGRRRPLVLPGLRHAPLLPAAARGHRPARPGRRSPPARSTVGPRRPRRPGVRRAASSRSAFATRPRAAWLDGAAGGRHPRPAGADPRGVPRQPAGRGQPPARPSVEHPELGPRRDDGRAPGDGGGARRGPPAAPRCWASTPPRCGPRWRGGALAGPAGATGGHRRPARRDPGHRPGRLHRRAGRQPPPGHAGQRRRQGRAAQRRPLPRLRADVRRLEPGQALGRPRPASRPADQERLYRLVEGVRRGGGELPPRAWRPGWAATTPRCGRSTPTSSRCRRAATATTRRWRRCPPSTRCCRRSGGIMAAQGGVASPDDEGEPVFITVAVHDVITPADQRVRAGQRPLRPAPDRPGPAGADLAGADGDGRAGGRAHPLRRVPAAAPRRLRLPRPGRRPGLRGRGRTASWWFVEGEPAHADRADRAHQRTDRRRQRPLRDRAPSRSSATITQFGQLVVGAGPPPGRGPLLDEHRAEVLAERDRSARSPGDRLTSSRTGSPPLVGAEPLLEARRRSWPASTGSATSSAARQPAAAPPRSSVAEGGVEVPQVRARPPEPARRRAGS